MDCTVVGDIFFDVIVGRDPSELGLVRGGTSYSGPIAIELGGTGNVAFGLSRLGGRVQFIGKAGKDALGRIYQENLTAEGVRTRILFDKSYPTGVTVIFVDKKGERSFLISRGANDFLFPKEVKQFESDIIKAKYLFVSGYSLVNRPQRESVMKAVKIAKSNDVKVVFDPGAHNLVRQKSLLFENLLNLCDVITPNWEEARALSNYDRIEEVARHLSKRVPIVALKMGKEGCVIITPDHRFKCQVDNVNCVDSTGAGDAFVSALIYGMSRNFPLEKTARLANWYASYNVQRLGPRSFPSKDEIRRYFSSLTT